MRNTCICHVLDSNKLIRMYIKIEHCFHTTSEGSCVFWILLSTLTNSYIFTDCIIYSGWFLAEINKFISIFWNFQSMQSLSLCEICLYSVIVFSLFFVIKWHCDHAVYNCIYSDHNSCIISTFYYIYYAPMSSSY